MNIILATLLFAMSSQALPSPPMKPDYAQVELIKCYSGKFGTLWASFGRMWRSEDKLPRHFPTEIVLFQKDTHFRLLFPDFREAIKIPVDIRKKFVGITFALNTVEGMKTHKITVMEYSDDLPSGYLGNWSVTGEDGKEDADQVGCTVM
jgi:hypothetical protein